jgi:hypothetical protein
VRKVAASSPFVNEPHKDRKAHNQSSVPNLLHWSLVTTGRLPQLPLAQPPPPWRADGIYSIFEKSLINRPRSISFALLGLSSLAHFGQFDQFKHPSIVAFTSSPSHVCFLHRQWLQPWLAIRSLFLPL